MKKYLALMLCLIYCISLLGCSNSPKINRKILPIDNSVGSISYGIYGMNGEIETDTHFQIESNSTFQKIFSFGNLIELEREYKLLVFANYQQINFSVDNDSPNSYFDFIAKPYQHIQFIITLPKFEDGHYDLLFVIVKDPYNFNLDDDYRKQTDMSHLITMRYSLTVGENQTDNRKFNEYEFSTIKDTALDGIFLNQDNSKLSRLLSINCNVKDKPELYIHIGNQSDLKKKYAIILLYDWSQELILNNNTIFVSVSPGSRLTIPFNLSTNVSGIHNLSAICVEEPFQKTTLYSSRADFSIRVGINVTKEGA